MEDPKKYDGKTVSFRGIVAVDPTFPPNTFAVGRHVMTCCVEDITFMGLACTGYPPEKLENGGWYTVTANLDIRFSTVYGKRGPVLAVTACVPAEEPEQEVATFY